MIRRCLIVAVLALAVPAWADDIPKLKRDPSGKIIAVPDGAASDNVAKGSSGRQAVIPSTPPSTPLDRYDDAGPPAKRSSADAFAAISARMTLTRRMQEDKAAQMQHAVDRVIREEHTHRAGGELTPRERALVDELRKRDREVQEHETQHFQTGRPFTHAPEYWYVIGPDRRKYAVSGVTRIDVGMVPGDPAATLEKFMTLRRAALAPLDPSEEDRRLARELDRAIVQVQTERNARLLQPAR